MMSIITRLKQGNFFRNAYIEFKSICFSGLTIISPKLNTKVMYRLAFGKNLDLKNPKTLNEKILWLKLNNYNNNPLVSRCADKYRVREYVRECGLEDILVELYGVYRNADDIPWESLPKQFVLKWNFGAGYNVICTDKDKMNKDAVISQMKIWGKEKYWLPHSELQYKDYPKLIVCEQLLNAKEE